MTVQTAEKFIVKFFNPVTHLLHSTHTVEADGAQGALKAALDVAQSTLRGTEIDHLATYDTAITDEFGNAIKSLGKLVSKAQLQARMDELARALDELEDDPEPQVKMQAPGLVIPPDKSSDPREVTPQPSQQVNAGTFTQADVDRMIAEREASRASQSGPAMG